MYKNKKYLLQCGSTAAALLLWTSGLQSKIPQQDSSDPLFKGITRHSQVVDSKEDQQLRQSLTASGFTFHDTVGVSHGWLFKEEYFKTDAYYELSYQQTEQLIRATYECYSMLLEAADFVINKHPELMTEFSIPPNLQPNIIQSWNKNKLDLIGRFDFLVDGQGDIKLLEFNGDTPMLLLESGIGQQLFREHRFATLGQFNQLESLITQAFKNFKNKDTLYLVGHLGIKEEHETINYMQRIASQTFNTNVLDIKQIENPQNKFLWKLYPYEWLSEEINFDQELDTWMEPAWKLVLSNKCMLPLLNLMFPQSSYLLESSFTSNSNSNNNSDSNSNNNNDSNSDRNDLVAKRAFGREGHSVIYQKDYSSHDDFISDSYKPIVIPKPPLLIQFDEHHSHQIPIGRPIFQKFFPTPAYQGRKITIGSWVVQGIPAGFGIREDIKGKTDDHSSFVSHLVNDLPQRVTVPVTVNAKAIRDRFYKQFQFKTILGLQETLESNNADYDIIKQLKEQLASSNQQAEVGSHYVDDAAAKTRKNRVAGGLLRSGG